MGSIGPNPIPDPTTNLHPLIAHFLGEFSLGRDQFKYAKTPNCPVFLSVSPMVVKACMTDDIDLFFIWLL